MRESEQTDWAWVNPLDLDEEGYYVGAESFPPLTTAAGRAVSAAASEADAAVIASVRARATLPDAHEGARRRAQMEVVVALFELYAEMGIDHPDAAGEVLAAIVADAAQVARLYRWEARRGSIPGRLRTLIYRRDGYACVECGSNDITQLTVDHRIPVALGGSDEPGNLRTLCKPCNSAKGKELR